MRKYLELLKSQVKLDMAYSAWYWANIVTTILQLLIVYAFWNAAFHGRHLIAGQTLSQMLTYIVVAMLLGGYTSGVGDQLASNIRDGSVGIEFMRPYDFLTKILMLDFGYKLTTVIRTSLPMFAIGCLFLHIHLPNSIPTCLLFLVSALLGILIGAQFDIIVGVLAFWTVNIWGLRMLRTAIFMFFTGSLIPISLFPDWLKSISAVLPFQSMVYVPAAIYAGSISGVTSVTDVLIQGAWLLGIALTVRLIWHFAVRKIVIFGG